MKLHCNFFIYFSWNSKVFFTAKWIRQRSWLFFIFPKQYDNFFDYSCVLQELWTWNCFCFDLHSCRTILCSQILQNGWIKVDWKFWRKKWPVSYSFTLDPNDNKIVYLRHHKIPHKNSELSCFLIHNTFSIIYPML